MYLYILKVRDSRYSRVRDVVDSGAVAKVI
jgi:hypothetical protein